MERERIAPQMAAQRETAVFEVRGQGRPIGACLRQKKWVGYLPLALELLGRFLARKLDWSIDRLLKALEEKRLDAKALVETENGMTGQLGVAAALELSWQELNDAIKVTFWQVMVGIAQSIGDAPAIDQIEQVRGAIAHLEEGVRSWIDNINDKDLIWPFLSIGLFYEGQGNYSFAEPWRRDCLEVVQQRLGEEHPSVATCQFSLGVLYQKQGRYPEAETLYRQALAISQSKLGSEHPTTQGILSWLNSLPPKDNPSEPI